MEAPRESCLHASAVSVAGRGLLILGPSGSGKSSLALRMLALGAKLISDDQTQLHRTEGGVIARCPAPELRGVIESRGFGLMRAPFVESATLALVLDLGQLESARLPPSRHMMVLGHKLPLVLRAQNPHLAETMMLYLGYGRYDSED